jgi:hypothetical protein
MTTRQYYSSSATQASLFGYKVFCFVGALWSRGFFGHHHIRLKRVHLWIFGDQTLTCVYNRSCVAFMAVDPGQVSASKSISFHHFREILRP